MTSSSAGKFSAKTPFLIFLVTLPIIVTYTVLFQQMRSLPMFDDFQALVSYAVQFQHLHGFGPKALYAIAAQHDEYKLIFEHILVGLQLSISPHIHYRFLVVLGNLFVLGIVWVYWTEYFATEPLNTRLVRFAPICLLLVQLNYVETLDWAMCGLQMIPVVVFVLASLHLMASQKRASFFLICFLAWLACLASSNGFLLAPIGALLLIQNRRRGRVLLHLSLWTVTFASALVMYLYRYARITRVVAIPHPSLLQKLRFFFSFLGSSIENMHHLPIRGGSTMLGIVVVAVFGYATFKRYYLEHPFAFYAALWVLLCAAGVAQVRSPLGPDLSLSDRYRLYSDLILVFGYGFLMSRVDRATVPLHRRRWIYASALACTVLLYVSSGWFGHKLLVRRRVAYEAGFRLYMADPAHNSPEVSITNDPILGGEPEFSRIVLNQAIAERVYIPPPNP